jgi:uncharacterized protein (DUF885 family)
MKPWFMLLAGLLFQPAQSTTDTPAWGALLADLEALNLPRPELDFARMRAQQPTQASLKRQAQQLHTVGSQLAGFQPQTACQQLFITAMKTALEAQRLRLGLMATDANAPVDYTGSIHDLPDGQQWYRYLTLWWLGEDIEPKALYQIGHESFDSAIEQLRADPLPHDLPPPERPDSTDEATIISAYQRLDEQVTGQLDRWFEPVAGVARLHIARSTQGADFPAPGYYNPNNLTMYYHPLQDSYDLRQADWLYLHEGVPGHHYQNQVAQLHNRCELPPLYQGQMAFSEGWAAYVETLGQQLGLYQHPHSHRFALKWQALRAMRVMTDVGIHAYGWTTEQASNHWLSRFPEGRDVMDREISRIQRWPMQVNTYVYGKHKIEQLKQHLQLQAEDTAGHRRFHHNLLSISRLPISSLNHYSLLFNPQEQP